MADRLTRTLDYRVTHKQASIAYSVFSMLAGTAQHNDPQPAVTDVYVADRYNKHSDAHGQGRTWSMPRCARHVIRMLRL